MKTILAQRGLRLIFIANMVSMLGSGMNSTATTWFLLQKTHSETALGTLIVLSTIPGILMLPFTGVIIDREDRRRLVMILDFGRSLVILWVALLALYGRVQLWHVYTMSTMVAAGFWMFWPTITALIQELTPESQLIQSNTFLMAGVQGGFLISGAVVGFAYDHIGLGGILLIDFSTYVISFLCYFGVRKGRTVVTRPISEEARQAKEEGPVAHYLHELREGLSYLKTRPDVMLIGAGWSLFLGAMMTQGIVTAPLCERILRVGAVGFGWLNGAWGVGAFASAMFASALIARIHARPSVRIAMGLLAAGVFVLPFSRYLLVAAAIYFLMGISRGVGGIAITSSMMETVPKHFMGRVQNTFFFAGTFLQLFMAYVIGTVAHRVSLALACAIVGLIYLTACLTTLVPARFRRVPAVEEELPQT